MKEPINSVAEPPPDCDAFPVELDRHLDPALNQGDWPDAARWPYEAAALLFEGEFPWP